METQPVETVAQVAVTLKLFGNALRTSIDTLLVFLHVEMALKRQPKESNAMTGTLLV